jgi:hypothetical protein
MNAMFAKDIAGAEAAGEVKKPSVEDTVRGLRRLADTVEKGRYVPESISVEVKTASDVSLEPTGWAIGSRVVERGFTFTFSYPETEQAEK